MSHKVARDIGLIGSFTALLVFFLGCFGVHLAADKVLITLVLIVAVRVCLGIVEK